MSFFPSRALRRLRIFEHVKKRQCIIRIIEREGALCSRHFCFLLPALSSCLSNFSRRLVSLKRPLKCLRIHKEIFFTRAALTDFSLTFERRIHKLSFEFVTSSDYFCQLISYISYRWFVVFYATYYVLPALDFQNNSRILWISRKFKKLNLN